jgi:hypothetical protein
VKQSVFYYSSMAKKWMTEALAVHRNAPKVIRIRAAASTKAKNGAQILLTAAQRCCRVARTLISKLRLSLLSRVGDSAAGRKVVDDSLAYLLSVWHGE